MMKVTGAEASSQQFITSMWAAKVFALIEGGNSRPAVLQILDSPDGALDLNLHCDALSAAAAHDVQSPAVSKAAWGDGSEGGGVK